MSQKLKDSGGREVFETGAVRDLVAGKGRFDLIPMSTIDDLCKNADFENFPYLALWALARLYDIGAQKYDERNWEKGICISTYYNSAWRHLIREKCGWIDEEHLVAIAWNLICMLWTIDEIMKGKLPISLWDLPNEIQEIDYDVASESKLLIDTSGRPLSLCASELIEYLIAKPNDIQCLVKATHAAMCALQEKERVTNGPQRT